YLGCDPSSGRLFHFHVHDRLVLGEKYVKNYRIPIEEAFLSSVRDQDGVAIPSPELELGVLSARALLKYRPRDAVKDVLGIRTPGVPEPTRAEIRWLLAKTTVRDVRATLGKAAGVVPPKIAGDFLEAFESEPRSGATFFVLRQRLRAALREQQRTGRIAATADYVATAWSRRRRLRVRKPETHMKPVAGGTTIALAGAGG